jgi:transcriptional regulator with XRE-family HTH domain
MGLQPVNTSPVEHRRPNDVVAEEIRVLMARRGVRQQVLAQLLGISQSQFSKRMLSKIVFDIEEIGKLADFFGVDMSELVGGQRTTPPPAGPGEGIWANNGSVRHQGLEPRTRWLRASLHEYALVA